MTERVSGLRTYQRLLRYARPHWRRLALAVIGMLIYAGTDTGFAMLMKVLLDESFLDEPSPWVAWIPVILLVVFLARSSAGFSSTYLMAYVGRRIVQTIRDELFAQLLRLPTRLYDTSATGQLISKLTYNVEQVAQAATKVVTVLIRDSFTVLGLLAWMFYLSWQLTLLMLVTAPALTVIVAYISKRFRHLSHNIQDSIGDFTHLIGEVAEGHRIVKLFGGEEYERRQFAEANEHNRRLHMRRTVINAASFPIIEFVLALALAVIIALVTQTQFLEGLTVGGFVSFVTAMMILFDPLKRLTTINAELQKGIAAGQSVFELLDQAPEPDRGTRGLGRASGRVTYENIRFAYSLDSGWVLEDVNLSVEPGELVALVGRSGSGKSTFVNLLPRFYDPIEGRITLDGLDIRALPLAELRRQLGYVGQEVTLFNDTIARNIAYGQLQRTDPAQLREAAEAAYAMEFIERLPNGFDTRVGQHGILLSGGQRQRLGIARALLKDAPLLILDEATSALDTESEAYVQSALERLMADRTTFVIAHRLSTVQRADRILVLNQGRIVETGSHRELLEQGGYYATLYQMQFRNPAARDPIVEAT